MLPHHSALLVSRVARTALPEALSVRRDWAHLEGNPSKSSLHPGSRNGIRGRGHLS